MGMPQYEAFIFYAREDEELRKDFEGHLKALEHEGILQAWSDRQIPAGADRSKSIDKRLDKVDLILFLISPSFVASPYYHGREMNRALERSAEGSAVVIPVILRPVVWETGLFAQLQALPVSGEPITSEKWSSKDEAFKKVVQGLRTRLLSQESRSFGTSSNSSANFSPQSMKTSHRAPSTEQHSCKAQPIIVGLIVTLILATMSLGVWMRLTQIDARRSDEFLYEVLLRSFRIAVENGEISRIENLSEEAREYYSSLKVGKDKSLQIEALAWHYKGIALDSGDQPSKAQDALARAVKIRRDLVAGDPSAPSLKSDLGASLTQLGVAMQHKGSYSEAAEKFDEAALIFSELTRIFPGDGDVIQRRLVAIFRQARIAVHQAQGNSAREREKLLDKSYDLYREVAALSENMIEQAVNRREEAKWKYYYAYSLSHIGRHEIKYHGNLDSAQRSFEKAFKIRNSLNENGESAESQSNLAGSYSDLMHLALKRQDLNEAIRLSELSIGLFKQSWTAEPENKRVFLAYCEQILKTGRVYRALREQDKAIDYFMKTKLLLEKDVSTSNSKDHLDVYAQAAYELGFFTAAPVREAVKRLQNMNAVTPELEQLLANTRI